MLKNEIWDCGLYAFWGSIATLALTWSDVNCLVKIIALGGRLRQASRPSLHGQEMSLVRVPLLHGPIEWVYICAVFIETGDSA